MYNLIDSEIVLSDNSTLDGKIFAILSALNAISSNGHISIIKKLSEIGLDIENTTLSDVAKAMQRQSIIILDLTSSGSYAAKLPLPSISNGNNIIYHSGVLIGLKMDDTVKVYFRYIAQGFTALATYNGHNQNPMTSWLYDRNATLIIAPTPSQFNNLISNIYVSGDYYFSGDQMKLFTDAPPGAGAGYLTVINSRGEKTSDRSFSFTENSPEAKTWRRISYSSNWVSTPSINLTAVPDASLRIGDMKITASGKLSIRTDSQTVKEL